MAKNRGNRSKDSKPKKKLDPAPSTSNLSKYDENYPQDLPQGFTKISKNWEESLDVLRETTDQGIKKTCWTIAITRGLSARLYVNEVVPNPIKLSALHLFTRIKGSSTTSNKNDSGELKENLQNIKKVLEDEGVLEEEQCLCEQSDKPKRKSKSQWCFDKLEGKRLYKAGNLVIIEKVNETELIKLLEKGPVIVSMDLHADFYSYQGGIYKGPRKCSKAPEKHMLLLTGYGTDEDGVHYWRFQNSWGIQWGEKGFGRILRQISRGKNQPSYFTSAICPEV